MSLWFIFPFLLPLSPCWFVLGAQNDPIRIKTDVLGLKSCCNLQTTPWHIWETSKMIIWHPESSSVFMSARLLIRPEIYGRFVIDFSVCVLVLCICPSSYWLLCTSSRPSSTVVFWAINSDDDKIGANVASALMREQRTSKQKQSSCWVFCGTSHQLLSSTWKSLRVSVTGNANWIPACLNTRVSSLVRNKNDVQSSQEQQRWGHMTTLSAAQSAFGALGHGGLSSSIFWIIVVWFHFLTV